MYLPRLKERLHTVTATIISAVASLRARSPIRVRRVDDRAKPASAASAGEVTVSQRPAVANRIADAAVQPAISTQGRETREDGRQQRSEQRRGDAACQYSGGIGGNEGWSVGRRPAGQQVVDHGREVLGAGKSPAERGGEAVADPARGGADQDDAVAKVLRCQSAAEQVGHRMRLDRAGRTVVVDGQPHAVVGGDEVEAERHARSEMQDHVVRSIRRRRRTASTGRLGNQASP